MKKILILLFSLFLLGCSDPEAVDFQNYLKRLSELHTHIRAAEDLYDKNSGKSELNLASTIKKRVLLQYEKYLTGLEEFKPNIKTPMVEELNQKGIKQIKETIDTLTRFQKVLLQRDTHSVLKARTDVDLAFKSIENWQTEIKELAMERGLSFNFDAAVKHGQE